MSVKFERKDSYSMEDFLEIIRILRAPGGCPWDREQTHRSIKKNFIEETYEVVEAINKEDAELLKEELGDVLLQVVMHTEMEREQGVFEFSDVVDGICKKMILRHPHVFSDVLVNNSEEVLKNWDAIKQESKQQKTQTSAMESIPVELPALMRAEKIQKKASRAGFDWQNVSGALEKLESELAELREAIAGRNPAEMEDELGDVLFSAVNVARFIKSDPEEALTGASNKFIRRFSLVETMAAEQGIPMAESALEELDALWDQAKIKLKESD